MTSEDQQFTYSAETEHSKPYPAVVTLGMRIVRELGFEDSVDTLGRWMSHRIAELMEQAESADTEVTKVAAKQECTDLILKVWERRKYWPQGQPLGDLSGFLHSVAPDPYSAPDNNETDEEKSWIKALPGIRKLHKYEDQIVFDSAIADLDLTEDKEWLEQHPDELTNEEHRTISWLIKRQEELHGQYYKLGTEAAPNFGGLSSAERAKLALILLDKINIERRKIFDEIANALGSSINE